jgi:uncharacterized membrane protein YdbT with pleckstrin-like domain
MSEETTLWKGGTSQLVNFWSYSAWLALAAGIIVAGTLMVNPFIYAALALPLGGIITRFLLTRSTRYELTSQRLKKSSGILTRRLDELELYRVKDSSLEQPLVLRMFGLGNVTILSSDASLPLVQIVAVNDAYAMREKLRLAVESERDRKRVRETELSGNEPSLPTT